MTTSTTTTTVVENGTTNGTSNTNGTTASSYLVVGSPQSAADGSYQSTLSELTEQNHQVHSQLWDRIVEGRVLSLSSSKYSNVLVLASGEEVGQANVSMLFDEIAKVTPSGSQLQVRRGLESWLDRKLELSGFINVIRSDDKMIATRGDPPAAASAAPLRLKRNKDAASAKKKTLWALTSAPNSSSTIDESSLLSAEDQARRSAIERPDCDVKRTRKPCKNCTCGLREVTLDNTQEDAPQGLNPNPPTVQATSSCGNCFLGDAFRCSGCPYLGLPAFEPGQKVELGSLIANDV